MIALGLSAGSAQANPSSKAFTSCSRMTTARSPRNGTPKAPLTTPPQRRGCWKRARRRIQRSGRHRKHRSFPDWNPYALRMVETPWRFPVPSSTLKTSPSRNFRITCSTILIFPARNWRPTARISVIDGRWPLSCLIVVLVAAPLGIVYNRRGVLAGVATGIFIFFSR